MGNLVQNPRFSEVLWLHNGGASATLPTLLPLLGVGSRVRFVRADIESNPANRSRFLEVIRPETDQLDRTGITWTAELRRERPSEVAAGATVDLLVLGPHRRRPNFHFGSTAEHVLPFTRVPVLIGGEEPRGALTTVLCAVDLGGPETNAVLAEAARLGRTLPCRIEVGSVVTQSELDAEPSAWLQSLSQRVAAVAGLENVGLHVVAASDPATGLQNLGGRADLVVLGRSPRMGMARWWGGDTTGKLGRFARHPLLLVQAEEP